MERNAMRVLVGIDGSAAADVAVGLVSRIAWPPETEVVVVEAFEPSSGLLSAPWAELALIEAEGLEDQIKAEAERNLANVQRQLERPGLTVRTEVLCGRPSTAIVERARTLPADVIVLGSRGHGTIGSMLLGSVSAEVVDHAPAPVLVARGTKFGRVLLAWDGSACAAQAADLLGSWPIFAGRSVNVVSVDDLGNAWWTGFPEPGAAETSSMYRLSSDAARSTHDRLAHQKADELRTVGLDAEAEHRDGDAATQLIAAATAHRSDVILMGTHGRTGLARLVIGSVARNVLHHAPCSVLVVREQKAANTHKTGQPG